MKNLNVNIRIVQAKDIYEGKIGDKYLGSLDYSLLTDYIETEEDLKEIIIDEGERKYSDDIISVRFDYGWECEIEYSDIETEWNRKYKKEHIKLTKELEEKHKNLKESKKEMRKNIIREFNKDNDKLYNIYKNLKSIKCKAKKDNKVFDKETEYEKIKKEYNLKLQEYINNDDKFQKLINEYVENENNLNNLKRNKKKQLKEIKNSYKKSTKQLRQ